MSELMPRYQAVKDRIHSLDQKTKNVANLTDEEKKELLEIALQCAISLSEIALAKMERGDTV